MEKVVLLREQIEYLEKRKKSLESLTNEGRYGYDALDANTKKKNGINDVNDLLNNHVIADSMEDHITLGSRFNLTLKDSFEETTEEYVLVSTNIGLEGKNAITAQSSLGKLLINRRIGDIIKYNVGSEEITATVGKIYTKEN